jgi:hypothetical protein
MEMFLGMSREEADGTGYRGTNEAEKIKETGTLNWVEESLAGNNEIGFTALPGGIAGEEGSPVFAGEGVWGFWWTATEDYPETAWSHLLTWSTQRIGRESLPSIIFLNVSCIKD